MDFTEKFSVEAAADEVWSAICDVERIAPCLPGAQLQTVEGDDYHGIVKIKVGPITSQYKGTAKFVSVDEDARRLNLEATGRDTKGAGNAKANIEVQVSGDDNVAEVEVSVNLNISGKVAQFGRGVLSDVSSKLMAQFAKNLSEMIAQDTAGGDSQDAGSDAGSGTKADSQATEAKPEAEPKQAEPAKPKQAEPEAVNLIEVTGSNKAKAGIAVVGAALLAVVLFVRRLFRRKKKSAD